MSDLLAAVDALVARPTYELPEPPVRKALREAAGVTQAEVASVIGISRVAYLAWEKGHSSPRGERREAYFRLLTGWAAKHPVAAAGFPSQKHN